MVISQYTIDIGDTQSLDSFDDVLYMGFGDGTSKPSSTQTTLDNEILRVTVTNIVKDTINNEYLFTGRIPITQYNSNTINEIGLFNASAGGDMAGRLLLITGLTKNSANELKFRVKVKNKTI